MFQISLRQLFVLVAFVALAIVSLKNAPGMWHGVVGLLAMVTILTAVLVAILDRGPRQAFAIGCAIAMLGYGLLVANGTKVAKGPGGSLVNFQLDINNGGILQQLPTTALLRYAYAGIQRTRWVDQTTGKEVTGYDYAKFQAAQAAAQNPGTSPVAAQTIFPQDWPPSDSFTLIGHYWWGFLFGFLGGHIARFVYLRRMKEQAAVSQTG
ncbi:MAG: hypothetical protein WD669_02850 [Pirellulales bacterium]